MATEKQVSSGDPEIELKFIVSAAADTLITNKHRSS